MKYILSLLILSSLLSACSFTDGIERVERGQSEQALLVKRQTLRLAMHEEYLAQIAEYQLELEEQLEDLAEQNREIQSALRERDQQVAEPASEPAVEPERVETTRLPNKTVIGRNEWVWLDPLQRNLKARIDTGALTSSLNATDIQNFERDGRNWVRFRVPDEEHPDGGDLYEAPLVRHVRIRQAAADELDRRPVVTLQVRLGGHVDVAEFNLTNRENMLYPLLLGRNFLRDLMLVDVARKFTQDKYRPDAAAAKAEGETAE